MPRGSQDPCHLEPQGPHAVSQVERMRVSCRLQLAAHSRPQSWAGKMGACSARHSQHHLLSRLLTGRASSNRRVTGTRASRRDGQATSLHLPVYPREDTAQDRGRPCVGQRPLSYMESGQRLGCPGRALARGLPRGPAAHRWRCECPSLCSSGTPARAPSSFLGSVAQAAPQDSGSTSQI